jgi:hypothetical protein
MISADSSQVDGSLSNYNVLFSLPTPGSALQELDVRLRTRSRGLPFFGSPCTHRDLSGVMSSQPFNMTLSQPLRLHVDRGLERHGYPWVPTDQGPGGPYQVDPTYQKPHRPTSGPETLSTTPTTLEYPRRPHSDPGRPAGLVVQASPLGCGAAPPVGPRIVGSAL